MRVQVRKCPFTGKIFEEDKIGAYIIHLKNLREQQREGRHLASVRKEFSKWLKAEKLRITDPEMIPEWFMTNQRMIMDAHNAGCRGKNQYSSDRDKFFKTDRFEKVSFERIARYEDMLSNSHVCPDNGVSNWCGKADDKPLGYPGWKVYIRGRLVRAKKHCSAYPYGEALNLVGIKTGSGGGGNESWGYEASIFLADWPGLNQWLKEQEAVKIVERLKGKF